MAVKPAVYIAGPMSNLPEFNRPAFHAAAAELRAQGHIVFSPAELRGEDSDPWELWMKKALALLVQADNIFLLDGWSKSRGARIEYNLAKKLNMGCLYARNYDKGGEYGG